MQHISIKRLRTLALSLLVAMAWAAPTEAAAQVRPPGSDRDGPAFRFEKVTDDIYLGMGTGALTVMSNAGILINDEDVLIVDSHVSPAAAAALLEELRTITDKPVRTVINSHFHFDHAHGNEIYPRSVEIIGHEYAHRMLASGASNRGRTVNRFLGGISANIERLQTQLAATTSAEERATLQRNIRIQENFKIATDAVRPTPPTITLNERMTLYRGQREIQLHFLGRGHTGGDIVIFLPKEKLIFSGDLLLPGVPYLGDAYIPEYIDTLERLKGLDFETVVPGHGRPFAGRERIDHLKAYLTDLWTQVSALHQQGVPVREAAQRIDMRAHSANYPQIRAVGVDFETVDRAYELLSAKP